MTVVNDIDVLNRVGNTPLVGLDSLSHDGIKYFAKLEGHNPFGSVKDRAAFWMIKDGEDRGILKKDKSIIIEPTSGNTGIALTGIANVLGYKVEIVIPDKVSNETKDIIRNLGAKVFETSDDLCAQKWVLALIRVLHLRHPSHHLDLIRIILQTNMPMRQTSVVTMLEPDLKFGNRLKAR